MEALGVIGTILTLIFALIAILAPVWLYLINVYTAASRDELRKVNKNLVTLIGLMKQQHATASPLPPAAGRVTCSACSASIPYPAKFAGQTKPCPKCQKPLTLQ